MGCCNLFARSVLLLFSRSHSSLLRLASTRIYTARIQQSRKYLSEFSRCYYSNCKELVEADSRVVSSVRFTRSVDLRSWGFSRFQSVPVLFSRSLSDMASSVSSVHDFTVKDARGNDVDLSTYKGKVLLIVNVASKCGFTNSNYTELAQLYEKYKGKGFEILAFPCNQFGGQEPGSNEEILQFACTRFKAEYPIFDKIDVNGDNTAPIYKFLKSSKGGVFGDGIKWNFTKFLVDKGGHVVGRYAPTTSPLNIEKDIKKLVDA